MYHAGNCAYCHTYTKNYVHWPIFYHVITARSGSPHAVSLVQFSEVCVSLVDVIDQRHSPGGKLCTNPAVRAGKVGEKCH